MQSVLPLVELDTEMLYKNVWEILEPVLILEVFATLEIRFMHSAKYVTKMSHVVS